MQAPHGKGNVHRVTMVSLHTIVFVVCGEDRKKVQRAGAVRYVHAVCEARTMFQGYCCTRPCCACM